MGWLEKKNQVPIKYRPVLFPDDPLGRGLPARPLAWLSWNPAHAFHASPRGRRVVSVAPLCPRLVFSNIRELSSGHGEKAPNTRS